jgi:uncharacterized protein YijF (DUF1287 family)
MPSYWEMWHIDSNVAMRELIDLGVYYTHVDARLRVSHSHPGLPTY